MPNDAGGLHTALLTFGPMARRVEDLELLLSVIIGADCGDPFSAPVPLKESSSVDVSKLRVIYFLDNGVITPDRDTLTNISSAIENLKPHVASITFVSPPEIFKETYRLVWDTCFLGGDGGQLLFQSLAKVDSPKFSPLFERHLENVKASSFDNPELRRRIAQMYEYKQAFLKLMENADILLCPVTATPARSHGTTHDNLNDYTYVMMSNLTGSPAASINCGFAEDGLPIGIQIIAKPWEDHVVLAVAKKAQEIFGVPEVVSL
ncbi:MAG: Amidase [Burkholderiales bacterium]|nr:Amidase [Burkholderiales bacterium]